MNLEPINPYQIIEGLKKENEELKAINTAQAAVIESLLSEEGVADDTVE